VCHVVCLARFVVVLCMVWYIKEHYILCESHICFILVFLFWCVAYTPKKKY
jgi:hypothetical protein